MKRYTPKNEPLVSLRVPRDLREVLVAEAMRAGTTLSSVILQHLAANLGFPQRPLRRYESRRSSPEPLPRLGKRRKQDEETTKGERPDA